MKWRDTKAEPSPIKFTPDLDFVNPGITLTAMAFGRFDVSPCRGEDSG